MWCRLDFDKVTTGNTKKNKPNLKRNVKKESDYIIYKFNVIKYDTTSRSKMFYSSSWPSISLNDDPIFSSLFQIFGNLIAGET